MKMKAHYIEENFNRGWNEMFHGQLLDEELIFQHRKRKSVLARTRSLLLDDSFKGIMNSQSGLHFIWTSEEHSSDLCKEKKKKAQLLLMQERPSPRPSSPMQHRSWATFNCWVASEDISREGSASLTPPNVLLTSPHPNCCPVRQPRGDWWSSQAPYPIINIFSWSTYWGWRDCWVYSIWIPVPNSGETRSI